MPKNASFLVKPSSSMCNMKCKYCFYADVAQNRENKSMGFMSLDTAKVLIKRAAQYADESCTFMFQGGEPTLAGLNFFREFLKEEKKYNRTFRHAIQTNGYVVDKEWAQFFKDNNFLVGLSLDGQQTIHDTNRVDSHMGGTWDKVMSCADILKQNDVDFNILSVITSQNARSIRKTYNFFKSQNFKYMQFIPCLDGFSKEYQSGYSLSEKAYADYLVNILTLWNDDMKRDKYYSIRHIDNMFKIINGGEPEICSMSGHCTVQFVIEGDGSVYPCDFYVLDEWQLGNIKNSSFDEMIHSDKAKKFISDSLSTPTQCNGCKVYALCRGGCRRDRAVGKDGKLGLNRHCKAYNDYYTFVLDSLNQS